MSKKIIYSFVLTFLFLDTSVYSMRFITRRSARNTTDELNHGEEETVQVTPAVEENDIELLKAYDVQNVNEPLLLENKNFYGAALNRKVLNEIQLNECNLSKVQFSEVDFIDAKLRNLDFKEGRFSSINFVFANLNKIDFTDATIFNSIFSESLIENSIFHDSYIANCKFANMLVRRKNEADGRDIITCKIKKNEFNFGAFERCSFKQVAFSGNCFWRSQMKKVYFKKCTFFDTDFSGVFMDEVGFEKCDFHNCKNLDKAFFGNKAVFNFCNFYEEGSLKEDINNLIRKMRNLGAEVEKKPGLKKKFKKAFGAVIIPATQIGLSYATGGAFELGRRTFAGNTQLTKEQVEQIQQLLAAVNK